jgi:uncharacterized protein with FMN-binding domain
VTRIVTWLLSTVAVLTLLFGYHTSTAGPASPASETVITAPATAPAATTPGSATSVTGSVADTRWGPVQVRISVANRRITSVDVPQQPDGNDRDEEINDYALPILVRNTLTAQSAHIDMVSGATVTSDGYVESLQSALDQAGL